MRIDQLIATMLTTLAFAVLFQAPKKEYLFCVLTGAIAWLGHSGLMNGSHADDPSASLLAAFFLTLAARSLSTFRRCPVTVFLMPGIIPLVPGTGIYKTAYFLIQNNLMGGAAEGINTFKIAMAIAIGIVLGFALPQPWFHKISNLARKIRDNIVARPTRK